MKSGMKKSEYVENFPIAKIDVDDDEFQGRFDYEPNHIGKLAKDIKEIGQTDAIKLWKHEDGSYQILDGFCRSKAIGENLNENTIKAQVYEGLTKEEAARIAISGNMKRKDYTENELAILTNEQRRTHTMEETAELLGISERSVHNNLFEAERLSKKQIKGWERLKLRHSVTSFDHKLAAVKAAKGLKVSSSEYTISKGRISEQAKRILLIMYNLRNEDSEDHRYDHEKKEIVFNPQSFCRLHSGEISVPET